MIWLVICLFCLAGVILISYFTYRIVFHVTPAGKCPDPHILPAGAQYEAGARQMAELIAALEAIPYETVSIVSRDGLTLYGKYYPAPTKNAPLEIILHGYRSTTLRDCCGAHQLARDAGHHILLVMNRAHELSEGNTISFGVKERYDCLDWIQWACRRLGKDTPIIISGVSMGAATVLMAANLPLPENVKGIIADCGYTSPPAIIRKVCRDCRIPDVLVYPFIWLGAVLFGHFRPEEASALEAVRHSAVPILFIHGEEDHFVPCGMCHELYDACASEKQILTVPKAAHGISFIVDTPGYAQAVKEFQAKVLP